MVDVEGTLAINWPNGSGLAEPLRISSILYEDC